MKTFKKIVLCLSAATVVFISCKDDDSSGNLPTTTALLQHSWMVDSITARYHTALKDTAISYLGQPADYFNFNTNDSLFQQLNNIKDTSVYSLLNSNTIIITHKDGGKDTATITLISENKFAASSKKMLNATDYVETKSWLER